MITAIQTLASYSAESQFEASVGWWFGPRDFRHEFHLLELSLSYEGLSPISHLITFAFGLSNRQFSFVPPFGPTEIGFQDSLDSRFNLFSLGHTVGQPRNVALVLGNMLGNQDKTFRFSVFSARQPLYLCCYLVLNNSIGVSSGDLRVLSSVAMRRRKKGDLISVYYSQPY